MFPLKQNFDYKRSNNSFFNFTNQNIKPYNHILHNYRQPKFTIRELSIIRPNVLRSDETSWWKVSKKQIVKKGAKTEKIKEEEEEDFYATSSSCLSKKDIFSPSFNDLSVTLLQSRSSSRCGLVALINAIQKLWWKRRVDGGDRVGVKGRRVKNKTQSKATSFQPCSNKKI